MSNREPMVRLFHMRDYARKALSFVEGKARGDLEKDEILRLALTHLLELVGEAASQFPREMQDKYPQIPWPKIIGMRNKLIHGYDYIDYDILWDAIIQDIPQLLEELEKILPPDKQGNH